jgi:hypothetical protein
MLCMQCWNLSEIYSLISNKLCLVFLIHGSKSILSQFLYWGFTLYGRNPSLKEKLEVWLALLPTCSTICQPTSTVPTFFLTLFSETMVMHYREPSCCHALMVMCYCTLLIRDHWVFSSTSYFIVLHRYK